MSTFDDSAQRAYEHACSVLDWMTHGNSVPVDPFPTIKKLEDAYVLVGDYLRNMSRDEAECDAWMSDVCRVREVIREAVLALLIRTVRPSCDPKLDSGTISTARDRLVESFGFGAPQADLFINLLEQSHRNGLLEASFRGSGNRVARILEIYRSLIRNRGRINFAELFAAAESEPETASA